ncbi:hypothetical protein J2W83_004285, partial [Pseudomonas hunanensis]|nr:hypothetical protein [Pseudomonas hunanensis]
RRGRPPTPPPRSTSTPPGGGGGGGGGPPPPPPRTGRKGLQSSPGSLKPDQISKTLKRMALTAGHFFSWKKVTKNRLLLHPALRCAAGPLAPVLLREDRAVRPLLGLSAFRPSMDSTSLRKTSTRPPEVTGGVWAGVVFDSDMGGGYSGLFAGQARSYRYRAESKICANPVAAAVRRSDMPREEAGTANANRRAQPCQPPHKSARKQTKRERSDSPAVALAVDLDLALDLQRLQEAERRSCAGRWRPWMAGKR